MALQYSILSFFILVCCSIPTSWAQRRLSCPLYSAQATKSATVGFCTCSVTACPTDSISIVAPTRYCNSTSNRMFVRVWDGTTVEMGAGSLHSSCSLVSKLSLSSLPGCQTVSLRQGCEGDTACEGVLQIIVEGSRSLRGLLSQSDAAVAEDVAMGQGAGMVSEQAVSSLSISPSCQFIGSSSSLTDDSKKRNPNLSETSIIIYSAVFVVAVLCCFGKYFIQRIMLCAHQKRPVGRVYADLSTPEVFPEGSAFAGLPLYPTAEACITPAIELTSIEVDGAILLDGDKMEEEKQDLEHIKGAVIAIPTS